MAHFSIRWKLANLSYRKRRSEETQDPKGHNPDGFSGLPGRQLFLGEIHFLPWKTETPAGLRSSGAWVPTPAAAKYMVHISRKRDAHIHSCTNQRRPQHTAFILISRLRPSTVVRLKRQRLTSEALFERWKNPHSKQTERTGNTLTHNQEREKKGTHQGRVCLGSQNDRLHTDRAGYDKPWKCTIHPWKAIRFGWCPVWYLDF